MSPQGLLPRRVYRGAVGAKRRYFAHKLPLALGAERATFVFVQAEDATASAVRTWGKQHAGLWAVQRQLLWPLGDNYFGRFRCDLDRCREYGDGLTSLWTARAPSTGS